MYNVIFSGFKTPEQAIAFAEWYEGSAEQNCDLPEELGVDSILTDMQQVFDAGGFKVENNSVKVPLKIFMLDETNN